MIWEQAPRLWRLAWLISGLLSVSHFVDLQADCTVTVNPSDGEVQLELGRLWKMQVVCWIAKRNLPHVTVNNWEITLFLPKPWKWKMAIFERKLWLEGPIFDFHDYGRKGTCFYFSTIFVDQSPGQDCHVRLQSCWRGGGCGNGCQCSEAAFGVYEAWSFLMLLVWGGKKHFLTFPNHHELICYHLTLFGPL